MTVAPRPRVALAQLWQEVNTFSPRHTGVAEFQELELTSGDAIGRRHRGTRSAMGGFMAVPSLQHVPAYSAAAWPGGPPDRGTAERLLTELGETLAASSPVDAVLLNLHGAMVAEGYPDMELEALRVVREALGEVPVGCVLDLHGIPSPQFIEETQVVVGYDTYPHVDMWERGWEAAELMAKLLSGERLVSRVTKIPLLTSPLVQATDTEPMSGLLSHARSRAEAAGVERISLLPGFPYCDVERAGFSIVGVAEESSLSVLDGVLDEVASSVLQRRDEFIVERPSAREAVAQALRAEATPVVIADIADNVGGGGAGDGTELLSELLQQGAEGAVVTIADAQVVHEAAEVGEGGELQTSVGAKLDRLHGSPVEVSCQVVGLFDGRYRSGGSYLTGHEFSMGNTARLESDGVTLVVTERAVPPFHAEQLTSVGVEPREARIITAKGAVAWRSAFGDVAGEVIEADTPGVTPLDPRKLLRTREPMGWSPTPDNVEDLR